MICIISDVQPLSLSMLWRMGLARHSCTRSLRSACARPGSRPPGLRCGEPHPGLGALHRRSVPISESAPVVDEGEARMQARPIIGDVPAYIGLAKKRMAPPAVPNALAAPNRTHMGETPQHVRFLTSKPIVLPSPGTPPGCPWKRRTGRFPRSGGDAVRSSSLGRN